MERIDENGTRWRPIRGYQNRYWISEKGEVWSNVTSSLLAGTLDAAGYPSVCLRVRSVQKTYRVHRLVVQEFLGDRELVVNHKDGDKTNNDLSNLEYCTQAENVQHATVNDLMGKYKNEFRKRVADVYRNSGLSAREVGHLFGVTHFSVLNWSKKFGI